jgi:hypothetical protein
MIVNDAEKLKMFMADIAVLKLRKKQIMLRPEDRDDPTKYITRNLELAAVWEQYEQDRKRMML